MAIRTLFDPLDDDLRKADPSVLRQRNQRLVLRLVWSAGTISRAEMARRTGLSRSTVSAIVNELLDRGLVSARGAGHSQGGRRPILLGFDDDAFRVVGVQIGSSHVAVAVTDLRLRVQHWVRQTHPARGNPESTLELVERLVRGALAAVDVPLERVLGMGVGVPSPVDPEAPGELSPVVLPAWEGRSVQRHLEHALGRPVLVDNDANLGALAEQWWGAGKGGGDLTYIKVGSGVGAGHTIGGRIFRGARGFAGEMGHLAIDPRGPRCVCGMKGCLVTLVGADRLVEQLREAGGEPLLTVDELVVAARRGDAAAAQVVGGAGRTLGVAISSLLALLSPSLVILGGPLVAAGDVLLDPLRDAVRRSSLTMEGAEERVQVGQLDGREVALGAATLMMQRALDDLGLFPPLGARRRAG